MAKVEALITPEVIVWARKRAGLSLERAAEKIKRSSEELKSWEAGTDKPSIAQARNLAELYRRPLAVFYLPEPPTDFETLRDFRRLATGAHEVFDTAIRLVMRGAIEKQRWLSEYLSGEGIEPLKFIGSASLQETAESVSKKIRNQLQLTIEDQLNTTTRAEALGLWIKQAEAQGIFILREGNLSPKQCRGFAIPDKYAPIIFINTEDSKSAQLFTLIHELAHLWIGSDGISNLASSGAYASNDNRRIEVFCNAVASETAVPTTEFEEEYRQLGNIDLEQKLEQMSRKFKVSELVLARRLLDTNRLTQNDYDNLDEKYEERWIEYKKREKAKQRSSAGGPNHYVTRLYSNGYPLTRTVIGAFYDGTINGREASGLLRVKVSGLTKLAATAGFSLPMSSL